MHPWFFFIIFFFWSQGFWAMFLKQRFEVITEVEVPVSIALRVGRKGKVWGCSCLKERARGWYVPWYLKAEITEKHLLAGRCKSLSAFCTLTFHCPLQSIWKDCAVPLIYLRERNCVKSLHSLASCLSDHIYIMAR